MPPRSPASRGALPPKGAASDLGSGPAVGLVPPRSPASHGALALQAAQPSEPAALRAVQACAGRLGAAALSPKGAASDLGSGPAVGLVPPRSPVSRGALALQAAQPSEPAALRAVQACAGRLGAAALSPKGAASDLGSGPAVGLVPPRSPASHGALAAAGCQPTQGRSARIGLAIRGRRGAGLAGPRATPPGRRRRRRFGGSQ